MVDDKLGNQYAGKATTYALKNANCALAYSYAKATIMVTTATALPALVQKKIDQGLAYTAETKAYVAAIPSKVMVLLLAVKVQLLAVPSTLTEASTSFKASMQKGKLQEDALKLYAKAKSMAQVKYDLALKKAKATTTLAKTTFTETTVKAKAEAAKLKPFVMQTKTKALALLAQAKAQVSTIMAKKTA